jgi:hypothetical protein
LVAYWLLEKVPEKLGKSEVFDFIGGQRGNRTPDTRIFNPVATTHIPA